MEIKTRYNIGDKVWVIADNKPTGFIIANIITYACQGHTSIWYVDENDEGYSQDNVFSTKEEIEELLK